MTQPFLEEFVAELKDHWLRADKTVEFHAPRMCTNDHSKNDTQEVTITATR